MHCLESILTFKLNDSCVVTLSKRLQKPSPDKTLKISELFVSQGKPLSKFNIFTRFYGRERNHNNKHEIISIQIIYIGAFIRTTVCF